jgi:predicted nucleotidyltransferase
MDNVMSVGRANVMTQEKEYGRDDDDLFNIEKSTLMPNNSFHYFTTNDLIYVI